MVVALERDASISFDYIPKFRHAKRATLAFYQSRLQ
jgi:hypothetical protein